MKKNYYPKHFNDKIKITKIKKSIIWNPYIPSSYYYKASIVKFQSITMRVPNYILGTEKEKSSISPAP